MRYALAVDSDPCDIIYRQLRLDGRPQEAPGATDQGIEQRGGELYQVRQFALFLRRHDLGTLTRAQGIHKAGRGGGEVEGEALGEYHVAMASSRSE